MLVRTVYLWSGTTSVLDCGSISHLYRTGWCNGNNTQISVLEVAGTNLGYFTYVPSWIFSVPTSARSQRQCRKICYHRLLQYPCLFTSHNYLSISKLCNYRSLDRVVKSVSICKTIIRAFASKTAWSWSYVKNPVAGKTFPPSVPLIQKPGNEMSLCGSILCPHVPEYTPWRSTPVTPTCLRISVSTKVSPIHQNSMPGGHKSRLPGRRGD